MLVKYLKDSWVNYLIVLIGAVFLGILLIETGVSNYTFYYVEGMILVFTLLITGISYYRKFRYYKKMNRILENLEEKYLLSEIIEEPEFLEGQLFYEVLTKCNKSMNDKIGYYSRQMKDYHEYIEMWIHEIKTPIASTKLIIENNKSNITNSIDEELDKIDYYIEQALYYARSKGVEKDYIIRNVDLYDIVTTSIKKQAKYLIAKKIKIELEELHYQVSTDTKWMDYIIGQVINNALKYSEERGTIHIYARSKEEQILMVIEDNGIGISEQDLPQVKEKGYTGETGRKFAKSTGMGLYLCNILCSKMGLSLEIDSKLNMGTKVSIVFPISSVYKEVI